MGEYSTTIPGIHPCFGQNLLLFREIHPNMVGDTTVFVVLDKICLCFGQNLLLFREIHPRKNMVGDILRYR